MITDYTIEPFGFFNGFMSEHATNYRVAVDVKINLEMAIKKYVGKNNLEVAMKNLTGNAMKDIKGGCNLINNWIISTPFGISAGSAYSWSTALHTFRKAWQRITVNALCLPSL
jgi:hypothetical protein